MAQVTLTEADINVLPAAIGSDTSGEAIRAVLKLVKMKKKIKAQEAAKEPTR